MAGRHKWLKIFAVVMGLLFLYNSPHQFSTTVNGFMGKINHMGSSLGTFASGINFNAK